MNVILRRMGLAAIPTLVLAACIATAPAPQSLRQYDKNDFVMECRTGYRSGTSSVMEDHGYTLLFEGSPTGILTYTDLIFHATYSTEKYDAPYLKVWVTPRDSQEELSATVYQFLSITTTLNQFVGDQGFTGLHYTYHPTTKAELQFSCSIGEALANPISP